MWNWLKSVASAPNRPAGLSTEQFDLLRVDLERLDKLNPRIAKRLLNFIASGENEDALAEVAGLTGASSAMVLNVTSGWFANKPKERHEFFQKLDTQDVVLLLRLASVYDAISRSEKRNLLMSGLPPDGEWLEVFLRELTQFSRNTYPAKAELQTKVRAETIEAMLKANGQPTDLLVRAALWIDPTRWGYGQNQGLLLSIPDYAKVLERYPDTLRESLAQKDYRCRVHALEFFGKAKISLATILDDIVAAAISPAKQVQEAATTLLFGQLPACLARIKEHAVNGSNDERLRAVRLLWQLKPDEARPFLEQRAKEDKSKKIVETIQELLVPTGATPDVEAEALELPPPVPEVDPIAPLPADFLPLLEACFKEVSKANDAGWEKVKGQPWAKVKREFTAPAPRKVVAMLEGREPIDAAKGVINPAHAGQEARKKLDELVLHPGCTLLHAVRWCRLMRGTPEGRNDFYFFSQYQAILTKFTKSRKMSVGLRELAAFLRAAGLPDGIIGRAYLQQGRHLHHPIFKVPEDKLWPYFGERLDLIEQCLGMKPQAFYDGSGYKDYWVDQRYHKALEVLAAFPTVPAVFLPVLWETALGPLKEFRLEAQDALARVPGKEAKIIAALGNGQQHVRANAAKWIERLKIKSAIAAVEAALVKEKSEVVKGPLFDALEALEVPLDSYLNRKNLEDEAKKGLAKPISKDIEWFPFAQLPEVTWKDTGKKISPEVIKWLLIQAFKLKESVPTPLLRRYASFFKDSQREALGKFIVQAWITYDTLPAYTQEEAAAKADASTKQMATYVATQRVKYPQYYEEWTEQKYYRAVLNGLLDECKDSAISAKGVLAVAAVCAGSDVVPMVQRYLKKWYGRRHNQGKALIQMLSCVDHPSAIQLLLSVGNRFRTKSIQEMAAQLCGELAERKGWTLDELADRTVPTAGFDEQGELELNYGTRSFTAKLNEDFEIGLINQDGKEVTSLPEPNKADDEAMAKEAKSRLSSARKELKGILKLQQERLYEAMCTQRSWLFEDWNTYLNQHVILGSYVQRLVWGVVEGRNLKKLFRPLADRSLTDEQDNAVDIPADAVIRLAHDALLTEAQRSAWTNHLSDYNITPLFAQFGRPKFELSPSRAEETTIKDFEGHLVEAFKLRGRLTKQGYTRGAAQDGGWWFTYHKRFLGLGLEAIIEFTGSPMPEENRTVALVSLYFQRLGEGQNFQDEKIPLGELPVVLLTECWNDLKLAASEGTGFDPEWEKKSAY